MYDIPSLTPRRVSITKQTVLSFLGGAQGDQVLRINIYSTESRNCFFHSSDFFLKSKTQYLQILVPKESRFCQKLVLWCQNLRPIFTAARKNIFDGGLSLGRVVLYPAVAVIELEVEFMVLESWNRKSENPLNLADQSHSDSSLSMAGG